ncbi:hypothetical protein AVEN_40869-1 [Araneus ventricosus]|uniref:Uncharacterized protein n=1 Tax=Araneus ventricosus TaxID=182803 RepID=A0A4Y2UXZ4_ARAVE|nr:hypothetical protein AVEN_40869-1 [Araneus ventricosus]
MDKWLKTETLKGSASRTEIRTTDLAAMEITVGQQDDNHEVQRLTDLSVQRSDVDMWILNPFNEAFFQKIEKLTVSEKEKLIELSTDSSLESEFKKRNLIDFWVAMKEEYQEPPPHTPPLGVKAIKYRTCGKSILVLYIH